MIGTDQCVSLHGRGGILQVGPQVIIACDELEIDAEALRVEAVSGQKFALGLACTKLTANRLIKVEGQSKSLQIYSGDVPPLLGPYKTTLQVNTARVSYQRYVDLRSILTAFRGTTHDYLAVSADKIEQAIVKESVYRRRILTYLQDNGAVTRTHSQYMLNLSILGSFGFALADLKSGPNEAVLKFLVQAGCFELK